MALVYHNGRFIPEDRIQKADAEALVLGQLRSFLDANEPGLVRWLVTYNHTQGKAITYKELREAILSGDVSTELLQEWQKDYARFVETHLQPAWRKAIKASVESLESTYSGWLFDPMGEGVRWWTENRAAEFVTNVTTTQIQGLRAVIQRAAVIEDLSVDELARAIRPMVGLSKPQAVANMRYYENLRASGVSAKRAQDLSLRYAARQHRLRGYTIARTELCSAYAHGAYEGTDGRDGQDLVYRGR